MSERTVIICGVDGPPEERRPCPNPIHNYPLPSSYVGAPEVAERRLRNGWRNPRCPRCGVYGWAPGRPTGSYDEPVSPQG